MSSINLNNGEEYIKEFKVLNDGVAGVVENVRVRIEKRASVDPEDKHPNYKLIAADDKGEVNEGFYYQVPDKEGKIDGFDKYQAQKLIHLAKGVFGDDVKFPVFGNPTEALDGVMKMVASELSKKPWRIVVTYGTTKKPSAYLGFKNFGSFIEPMDQPSKLKLSTSDNTVKITVEKATPTETLIGNMSGESLDWMNQ
jgi:hypothetical protein